MRGVHGRWCASRDWGCIARGVVRRLGRVAHVVLFVMFLASHLRASVEKLRATRNHVMATYYTNLWFVCILNLLRCGVRCGRLAAEPRSAVERASGSPRDRDGFAGGPRRWRAYYLAHGHSRAVGAAAALRETVVIAMGVAGIDLLAKSVLIFGFGVQVFVEEPGLHSRATGKVGVLGREGLHRGARLRRPYRAPENAVP